METVVYYPIFIDLRGRNCLVVGGGSIATGKVAGLIEAGARVSVVSPTASEPIAAWHADGKCIWHQREFVTGDIGDSFLVIAATADRALNASIFELASPDRRLANAVDDIDHCNFIAPAVARAGAIQVAVSTSGKSPALAKQIRDEIEAEVLTTERSRLVEYMGEWRGDVKRALPTYQQRMVFWEDALRSRLPTLLAGCHRDIADAYMRELIAHAQEANLVAG